MKKENAVFIISGIIILALIILIIFSSFIVPIFQKIPQKQGKIVHVQKMPVNFEIVESYIIGFNTDRNLNFGQVGRGSIATKKITIINVFKEKVNVSIKVDENISKFIFTNETGFVLNINENKTIPISVSVNKSEEFGNYSGFLEVVMERV